MLKPLLSVFVLALAVTASAAAQSGPAAPASTSAQAAAKAEVDTLSLLLTLLRETPGDLVLLDYETNCDVNNLRKPLSHAGLIKAYLENQYPV